MMYGASILTSATGTEYLTFIFCGQTGTRRGCISLLHVFYNCCRLLCIPQLQTSLHLVLAH